MLLLKDKVEKSEQKIENVNTMLCPYKECDSSFKNLTILNRHIRSVHMKLKQTCTKCKGEYAVRYFNEVHKQNCNGLPQKVRRKRPQAQVSLNLSKKVTKQQKSVTLDFPITSKINNRANVNLPRTKPITTKVSSLKQPVYSCPYLPCNSTFGYIGNMYKHIKIYHSNFAKQPVKIKKKYIRQKPKNFDGNVQKLKIIVATQEQDLNKTGGNENTSVKRQVSFSNSNYKYNATSELKRNKQQNHINAKNNQSRVINSHVKSNSLQFFKNNEIIEEKQQSKKEIISKEAKRQIICPNSACRLLLDDNSQLQDHINRVHSGFPCGKCHEKFPWEVLPTHMKTCSSDAQKVTKMPTITKQDSNDQSDNIYSRSILPCETCQRTFPWALLRTHSKICKANIVEKKFQPIPNQNATNSKLNSAAEKFECDICAQSFSTRRQKNNHKSNHHMSFKCTWENCNLVYKRKASLSDHVMKKHSLKK